MKMLEIGPKDNPALKQHEDEHDVVYLDAVDRMGNCVVHKWEHGNDLPFDDGTFDYIYCSHILEHIPYFAEQWAFEDLYRVMAEGGQLHIMVPDGKWIGQQLVMEMTGGAFKGFMFGGMVDEFDVHVNVFTKLSITARLQHTGFAVYGVKFMDYHMTHGEYGEIDARQIYAIGCKVPQELIVD